MVFVGRSREIGRIAAQLAAGGNVVVSGKLGSGRTALVRQVAEVMGDERRFHFGSFLQGPAGICFGLLRQLGVRLTTSRGHSLSFVSARARLLRAKPHDPERHVLVFDDILSLTAPKLALVRSLALTGHYQFVAIVDDHLGDDDLTHLRVALYPVCDVAVLRLSQRDSREFFTRVSAELDLGLGEGEIAGLASSMGGYPLMMVEAANRAARRSAPGQGGTRPTPAPQKPPGRTGPPCLRTGEG